jgi:hypothetical protein
MKISSDGSSGDKKGGDEHRGSNDSLNSGNNFIPNSNTTDRLSLYVANESAFLPPNTRMNRLAIHMPADDFIFEEPLGVEIEDNYLLATM